MRKLYTVLFFTLLSVGNVIVGILPPIDKVSLVNLAVAGFCSAIVLYEISSGDDACDDKQI